MLYLLMTVNKLDLQGNEHMSSIMVFTVLLGVFLRGIRAVSLSHWYAGRRAKGGNDV